MKLTKKQEAEVTKVYDTWLHSYLNGDVKTYDSYLDKDYHFIGSTDNEDFLTRKETTKFFKTTAEQLAGKCQIKNNIRIIEKFDELVFITERFDANFLIGKEWVYYGKFRFSSVMHKKAEGWRFIYQHFSMPDSKAQDGETLGAEQVSKENQELRDAIKRRTAELEIKNRELEIETSLEKVRAVAMGMHKPDDMLDVCKILYHELKSLGFDELRNAMIHSFPEDNVFFINYDYSPSTKGLIVQIPCKGNSSIEKFIKVIRKSADAFHHLVVKGKELKDWIAFRKANKEPNDPRLNKIDSLHYYNYSVGNSGIGISTYSPISKEKQQLLQRFKNVFQLAYQRYSDITLAEAQVREAQIEASLERVRSRSLAMHTTSELQDVIHTVHKELLNLNIAINGGSFISINSDIETTLRCWGAGGTADTTEEVHIPLYKKPFCTNLINKIKKGPGFFTEAFTQKEKKDFFTFLFKHEPWKKLKAKEKKETLSSPGGYTRSCFVSKHTSIFIINHFGENFSVADNDILQRFAKVFDQTYTRFLDLQKAEAQAREARIETSLERVRAQAMAMHQQEDLVKICETLYKEFNVLGFDSLRNAMINIHNDEQKTFVNYDYSDAIGKSINHLTYNIHPEIEKQIKQVRKANDAFSETVFKGKGLENWKKFRKKIGEKDDPRIKNCKALYYYFYSIGTGAIGLSSFSPLPEEKLDLLKRFRNVFVLAYQRYTDISLAAAQTREAEIELALERVRARTMAMQKSEELSETTHLLFEQLKNLGQTAAQLSIGIIKEEKGVFELSATVHGTSLLQTYDVPLDEPFIIKKAVKAWKQKKKILTVELRGKELTVYNNWRNSVLKKKIVFPEKQWIVNIVFFSKGLLSFSSDKEISKETFQLLERFANVFDGTYTRFLDLQKAEAQAKEARIETALERVRAVVMAMKKSEEVINVCEVMYKELQSLGFTNIRNAQIALKNDSRQSYSISVYSDNESVIFGEAHYHSSPIVKDLYRELEKSKDAFYQREFSGKKFNDWRKWREGLSPFADSREASAASMCFYLYSIGIGHIGISTFNAITEIQIEMLKRFKNVFELCYTRYIDVAKAEAQAREAQIELGLERVRARAMAMQKSQELKELIGRVFVELTKLDLVLTPCLIMIYDPKTNDSTWWMANSEAPTEPIGLKVQYHGHAPYLAYIKAWQKKQLKWTYSLEGETKNQWDNFLFTETELSHLPDFVIAGMKAPDKVYLNASFNSFGNLTLATLEPLSDEHFDIMLRFAKVFDLTYTRFNDLQKAEAQAREAQIETALERVRSRTMGMQKSEELKEVIKIVYQQLTHLKIKLDHAGFVVDYTPKGDWHFWIADEQDIPSKITHPYFESVWATQFNDAKEKEADIFTTHLNFKEKNKFYKELLSYVPGLPQAAKDFYLSCPGLAASTVLFDDVSLYMENFSGIPYTDEENKILMRFGKVFQQTYTRFLDLQKAEAQTREAKIEAALEKVRASAMAMHHSHELDELLTVLFDQFDVLGIQPMTTHMTLIDMENNTFTFRETGKGGRRSFGEQRVAIDSMDIWTDAADKWRNSEPLAINSLHFPPESLPMLWQVFHESFAAMPEGSKITPEDYPDGIYHTAGKQPFGYIGMNQIRKATQEEEQIVVKFASEFGRAYTRFLDLQKAEAQAREAKIEAALEKVRSRTMAMQSSNELQETAAVLFQEFKKLGAENIYQVTIGIYNEIERTIDFRVTSWADSGEQENRSFSLDMNEPYLIQPAISAWKSGKKSAVFDLTGEALQGWLNYRNKMSGITVKSSDTDGRRVITAAYFSKGHLTISTPIPPPQETIKTLERFATVFDGTYTRFLDLEKAEAQAREAKIEAALERVRSRTLAMQKSDELAETAAEVFHQLIGLGIDPNRLYIGIVNAVTKDMEMWATDEDGSGVGKKFTFNAGDNESVKKLYDGWVSKEKSVSVDMQGKELENYFRYLQQLHIPISHGLKQKRRVQSVAYFDKGFIGMASPDELSGQNIELLERFAAVFNLTFTRFSDLKIAEAHALQAEQDLIAIKEAKQKAEDALTELQSTQKQLIQSEKMASLGELTAGIAHEIQNPLNFVNNFSEVSKELLDEIKEEIGKGNLEDAMEIMNDVIQNLEKINHHGKRADGIVKGMLQHSRSSSGVKELTDINALCDEYLRLAYHGLRAKDKSFNATMKTDFDASLEKINVMPQDIGRVILNLITNAFYVVNEKKNTPQPPEGGVKYEPTVTITTSSIHPPSGNRSIQIKVTDNGGGIPQKVLDKIFQPFFTTKPTGQGTGLGLSLAFDIVTKGHGGELKVETKEGEGTEFIILLPV